MTDPTPNPVVERADQDKKMLDRIVAIGQDLATAQTDPEIMTASALISPKRSTSPSSSNKPPGGSAHNLREVFRYLTALAR
jgi:hypothetical protein